MKLFDNIALVSMATASLAMSVAPSKDAAMVAARDEPNGAKCTATSKSGRWDVVINTWGPWDDDYGNALLVQLRNHCGGESVILGWGFGYEAGAPPTHGYAVFTINSIPGHCLEDAIWQTSNEHGGAIWDLQCTFQ
ncbi:hypothetical protein GQ53DRAFT_804272 [Thozetella sp. PMI_491]|nr:hypothetical protein GQ53DRAFT_804272 [Thozetella sp. PMI_491]